VGIDVEPKVLEEARRIVGSNTEIADGDVYNLKYGDASFDIVHCHQVLQHLRDPLAALKEMKRVSKSIVTSREVDYESWLWYPIDPRLQKFRDTYRAVCWKNKAEPDAGRRVKKWFMEAGFDPDLIQVLPSAVNYSSQERIRFISQSWAQRVRDTNLGKQMVLYGLASQGEVDEMAQAWLEWGEKKDAVFFYVDVAVVGRKSSG
jgi:ubiquinone/menaquinone biosynthesis C-methylase UbiE